MAEVQKHRWGHDEWKLTSTEHSVSCFNLKPQWRSRVNKVPAGRADGMVLLQCDKWLTAPNDHAPYDGRLVSADSSAARACSFEAAANFEMRGELILAVRAPSKPTEIRADGTPTMHCYIIPKTNKRKVDDIDKA